MESHLVEERGERERGGGGGGGVKCAYNTHLNVHGYFVNILPVRQLSKQAMLG